MRIRASSRVRGFSRLQGGGRGFEPLSAHGKVRAGEDVAIVLTAKNAFHDFEVKGVGHVVGAKENKTRRGGLTLDEPGTYKCRCSVPGHRANGMRGTIVVQE